MTNHGNFDLRSLCFLDPIVVVKNELLCIIFDACQNVCIKPKIEVLLKAQQNSVCVELLFLFFNFLTVVGTSLRMYLVYKINVVVSRVAVKDFPVVFCCLT